MIKNTFKYYFKKIKRYFKENKKSRLLVAFLMVLAVTFLSVGIYFLTKRGLLETQGGLDPFLNKAIPLYIYEIFLLVISFLIFVSASIFGLFNFFKKEKDSWIISSPEYVKLAWSKLIRAIIDSAWPILIIAIPLLLAIKSVFNLNYSSFLISFFSVFTLSIFTTILAISIIFTISLLLKLFNFNNFKTLFFTVGSVSLALGALIWGRVVGSNLESLFQFENPRAGLEAISANFAIFPSHLSALTIYLLQEGEVITTAQYLGLLTIFLLLVVLFFNFLRSKYLYLWQIFQEGYGESKEAQKAKNKILFNLSTKNIFFKKELLTFLRSPENIFWASFLSLLMFIQVGVINLLQQYIHLSDQLFFENIISSLQLGVVLFFISTIILRFVFPSFSQEGNTSWIIGSAPINLKRIFNKKFIFFSFLTSLIALVAFSLYLIPIPIGWRVTLIFPLILIISCLTLTAIGLSMGVVFINFETDNLQKLSTSGPGIGFVLISLLYSSLSALLAYYFLQTNNYLLLALFVFISFLLYLISKKYTLKSLDNIEFI
jgi:hypothetical protein